jgi:hypothetical protein
MRIPVRRQIDRYAMPPIESLAIRSYRPRFLCPAGPSTISKFLGRMPGWSPSRGRVGEDERGVLPDREAEHLHAGLARCDPTARFR